MMGSLQETYITLASEEGNRALSLRDYMFFTVRLNRSCDMDQNLYPNIRKIGSIIKKNTMINHCQQILTHEPRNRSEFSMILSSAHDQHNIFLPYSKLAFFHALLSTNICSYDINISANFRSDEIENTHLIFRFAHVRYPYLAKGHK